MGVSHKIHKHVVPNADLRNFIFGVEDSLVSTVGLLAGVAAADISRSAVVITGLVLIVVEGLSMGIGSFLSEETTEELAGQKLHTWKSIKGGIIMLFSYCFAGLIPLAPYTIFPGELAVTVSIIASLLGLFVLGLGTSSYFHRPKPWVRGFKMLFLGGLAVLVGMLVGKLFHL